MTPMTRSISVCQSNSHVAEIDQRNLGKRSLKVESWLYGRKYSLLCLQLNCISSYFILRLKYLPRAGWSTIRRNEDVNVNRFEEIVGCRPQIGL